MKQTIQLSGLRAIVAGLAVIGVTCTACAQLIGNQLVADLNPGSAGSYPSNLTVFADSLHFSAYAQSTGRELWSYSGTNINLVTNINDTVTDLGGGVFVGNGSNPNWLTVFSNALYFSAFDPRHGDELWRYDGTNAVRMADINPDANDTIKTNPASSFPSELTVLGNALFFRADGGVVRPNYELWKYSSGSVTQVANIHPDIGSDYGSYPAGLTAFNGILYFMANDGSHGYELWKSTGTGAELLADINQGGAISSSFPKYFTAFSNQLYFQATNSAFGYELWRSDGTNTALVTDLNPGTNSSYPEFLTVFQNALYFRATDGTNGFELWKYDGLTPTLVSNINLTGDSFPKNLTVFQNKLYFAADDGIHGWELWGYDGTNAALVADLNPVGDSFPEHLIVFDNALYFVATTPDTGYEWWRYDGNAVTLAADVNPGIGNSFPLLAVVFNQKLYFSAADDGVSNWELWALWPAPFRFTSIAPLGSDIQITWTTLGGRTNVVQASDNPSGPYTNLSDPIVILGVGESGTNYRDTNQTTASPLRFYRVVQP